MKLFSKTTIKRCLAMLLVIVLLTGNAEQLVAYAAETPTMTAGLYTGADLENMEADLMTQNAAVNGWESGATKVVKLSLSGLEVTGSYSYQLVLTMDQAIYVSAPDRSAEQWVSKYTAKNKGSVKVNKDRYLSLNANCGTFTYDISTSTGGADILFTINYDWRFWDQYPGAVLGYQARYKNDLASPLFTATLIKVTGSTKQTVASANLQSATAWATKGLLDAEMGAICTPDYTSTTSVNMTQTLYMRYRGVSGFVVPETYTIEVGLPFYKESDGTVHSMEFVHGTNLNGHYFASSVENTALVTLKEERVNDKGQRVAVFELTDYWGRTSAPYNYFAMKLPESADKFEEPGASLPSFTGAYVRAWIGDKELAQVWQGAALKMVSTKVVSLSFGTAASDNTGGASIGFLVSEMDHVQLADYYTITNAGVMDSGEITVMQQFDMSGGSAAWHTFGVTDIRLILLKGQKTTVYYKMWRPKADGTPETTEDWLQMDIDNSGATSDTSGYLLSRKDLPDGYNSWYFKAVVHVIPNIPKDDPKTKVPEHKPYEADGMKSMTSAGTVWGRMLRNYDCRTWNLYTTFLGDQTAYCINTLNSFTSKPAGSYHHIGIPRYTEDDDEGEAARKVQNNRTGYSVDKVYVYKPDAANTTTTQTQIYPGEAVVLQAQLAVRPYVNHYRATLDKIRFGVLLPKDVFFGPEDVWMALEDGTIVECQKVTKTLQDNGTEQFWLIEADPTVKIGYCSEGLGTLEAGSRVNLKITLRTDLNTQATSITIHKKGIESCRLFAAGEGIPVNNNAYVGTHFATKDTYGMLGEDAVGMNETYRLVSKIFDDHSDVIINIEPPRAQLEITNQFTQTNGTSATLAGENDNLTYELTLNCTKGGSIEEFFYYVPIPRRGLSKEDFGVETNFDMVLVDQVELIHSQTSSQMSVFYTTEDVKSYSEAKALPDSAWLPTAVAQSAAWENVTMLKLVPANPSEPIANGTTVKLRANLKYADSNDGTYAENAGRVLSWRSKGYYYYQFGGSANYGNYATETVSIALKYTAPVQRITLVAGDDAQKTNQINIGDILGNVAESVDFTIENVVTNGDFMLVNHKSTNWASLNSQMSNTQFGITAQLAGEPVIMEAQLPDPLAMGSTAIDQNTWLTLQIYNGNMITENASSKVVTFDLVGSNNTLIPVEINIARVLTPATAKQSGIIGGKSYTTFDDKTESVAVSSGSAVTAQYAFTFITESYHVPVLSFDTALPKGKILMLDWTDTTDPQYYYFESDGSAKDITLTSFKRIGGDGNWMVSAQQQVDQSMLFVLPSVSSGRTMSLKLMGKNGAQDLVIALKYSVTDARTFTLDLTGGGASVPVGSEFGIRYGASCVSDGRNDSRYQNRATGLVLTGTGLPLDLILEVDGQNYDRNANGEYIIPLGMAQISSGEISVKALTTSYLNSNLSLNASLYVSGTSNGSMPKLELVANSLTIGLTKPAEDPAFKVVSMSKRVVQKVDLGKDITVKIQKANLNPGTTIELEVWTREGNAYAPAPGVLTASSGLTATNGESTVTIRIGSNTAPGTYRLLFIITDGAEVMEVPYNFVVVD